MAHRIFDVDQHLCDVEVDFGPFIANIARDDLPRSVEFEGRRRIALGGKLYPKPHGFGRGSPSGSGAGGSLTWSERVDAVERMNIGHALLLPGNVGMAIHGIEMQTVHSEVASGYRRWQLANWSEQGDNRFAVALLADSRSVPTMAEISHPAVKALFTRPADAQGTRFDSDDMAALFRRASDSGLPIVLHGSTGYYQRSPIADRYEDYFYTHLYSHFTEMQVALGEIISSGALERFSDLRFVFAEAGVWWVPGFVERLIWHMDTFSSMVRGTASRVKDLIYERCLFCCQVEDVSGLEVILQHNPWLRVAIGTDIPHWDAIDPEAILSSLSETDAHAVRWGNASSVILRNGGSV
ncbi:amidohydrolase family protein [Burkholderia ambifaria]|uniref:amidohydrolase family protein n=1 Tax=Burkholderia ambifaria TaxID=152480 RepID=UPI000F7FBC9C|nr:amidohydrolase family protein [Burkholderia ambifaria]